jgi:hypothetical protein
LIVFVAKVAVQARPLDVILALPDWLATETVTAPSAENKLEGADVISKLSAPPVLVARSSLETFITMSTEVAVVPCT